MSTEDGFTLNHPLPVVLYDHDGEHHDGEHKEWGLLLLLNGTILAITAILMGIAMTLSLGNPIEVFGDAKAALTDNSALQPHPVQPSVGAHAVPPAAGSIRDQTVTASDAAGQSQRDISEAPSDALLKQFQAWAAKPDVPTQIERVRPMQNARAQDSQSAPVPLMQEHQVSRPFQNARAEVRRLQHHRARIRRDEDAR